MNAERITWKSTWCRHHTIRWGTGTEYHVMFSDIPEYIKEKWLVFAKEICTEEEIANPSLEMCAILMPDGTVENISIEYYFDMPVAFDLTTQDEQEMCEKFKNFCLKYGANYPDAYDEKSDTLLGEEEYRKKAKDEVDELTL